MIRCVVREQVGRDGRVLLGERFHVDDEVLEHGEGAERLDRDARAEVADQDLAGEPLDAVDARRVTAAHAVAAAAAVREASVAFPLDVVEQVEDADGGERRGCALPSVGGARPRDRSGGCGG